MLVAGFEPLPIQSAQLCRISQVVSLPCGSIAILHYNLGSAYVWFLVSTNLRGYICQEQLPAYHVSARTPLERVHSR